MNILTCRLKMTNTTGKRKSEGISGTKAIKTPDDMIDMLCDIEDAFPNLSFFGSDAVGSRAGGSSNGVAALTNGPGFFQMSPRKWLTGRFRKSIRFSRHLVRGADLWNPSDEHFLKQASEK